MRQNRIKIGNDFELSICESKGWKHQSKSPIIRWSGIGMSNFKKIESLNFDSTKFKPTDKSDYSKFDGINENNEPIEIKKYIKSDLNNWKLYSEPMFKVSTWKTLVSVINIFGNDGVKRNIKLKDLYPECSEKYNNLIINGDRDKAIVKYNNFIDELSNSEICKDIIERITNSNIGIQIEDCFISQSDLEYRWNISTNDWAGFHRYRIEFKLK